MNDCWSPTSSFSSGILKDFSQTSLYTGNTHFWSSHIAYHPLSFTPPPSRGSLPKARESATSPVTTGRILLLAYLIHAEVCSFCLQAGTDRGRESVQAGARPSLQAEGRRLSSDWGNLKPHMWFVQSRLLPVAPLPVSGCSFPAFLNVPSTRSLLRLT